MMSLLEIITRSRITAVIRLDDLTYAASLIEALLTGGIRSLEFTLTNPDALRVVEQMRQRFPIFDSGEAVIGIGSLRKIKQVEQALDAGAQLLVSPVWVEGLIELAHEHHTLCAVGAYTPTEIEKTWQSGADFVKVFPANTLGAGYMKSILAPMPDIRLMPTGGINLENLPDYLKAGCAAVGIGSDLIQPQMIREKNWRELIQLASLYVRAVEAR